MTLEDEIDILVEVWKNENFRQRAEAVARAFSRVGYEDGFPEYRDFLHYENQVMEPVFHYAQSLEHEKEWDQVKLYRLVTSSFEHLTVVAAALGSSFEARMIPMLYEMSENIGAAASEALRELLKSGKMTRDEYRTWEGRLKVTRIGLKNLGVMK